MSPQVPGQGSVHLYLWHARFVGHSAFTTHSGLQFGGDPWYSGRHEHTAFPFLSMHLLFGPQGDGVHGCGVSGGSAVGQVRNKITKISKILDLEKKRKSSNILKRNNVRPRALKNVNKPKLCRIISSGSSITNFYFIWKKKFLSTYSHVFINITLKNPFQVSKKL